MSSYRPVQTAETLFPSIMFPNARQPLGPRCAGASQTMIASCGVSRSLILSKATHRLCWQNQPTQRARALSFGGGIGSIDCAELEIARLRGWSTIMCHTWSIARDARQLPDRTSQVDVATLSRSAMLLLPAPCQRRSSFSRATSTLPCSVFERPSRSDLRTAMYRSICDGRHIGSGKTRI
jgi:hypothetical protein